MIDPLTIAYIKKLILKSSEHLDLKTNSNPESLFIDVNIIKQTERTYRVVGILSLAANAINHIEETPDEELKNLHFTLRKKVILDDHNPITLSWLENGWIIKEIRFKKDEKTIDSMHYRMGYRLHKYEEEQIQKKKNVRDQEFQIWKEGVSSLKYKLEQQISQKHKKGLQLLINIINGIYRLNIQDIKVSPLFPSKWILLKRLKFLHFALAFAHLCLTKTYFDWKEIGASYYKKIGGSKEFDLNKNEFISQLEEWTQSPADSLGLISLGEITPLYFSGQIAGQFSTYNFGPVHALTNLAILEEEYSTTATALWLVENRAILTRMAAEKEFIKETNSLVMCVDGHLRTSHKQCIQQLLQNSYLEQVIIWSDYDPDGLQIARELYVAALQYGSPILNGLPMNLK